MPGHQRTDRPGHGKLPGARKCPIVLFLLATTTPFPDSSQPKVEHNARRTRPLLSNREQLYNCALQDSLSSRSIFHYGRSSDSPPVCRPSRCAGCATVALSLQTDAPARRPDGDYSSGNCSGFSPDSVLSPAGLTSQGTARFTKSLFTLNSWRSYPMLLHQERPSAFPDMFHLLLHRSTSFSVSTSILDP